MASVAAKSVERSNIRSDKSKVEGVWTGGGAAADCTQSQDDHSAGITAVAYNGATGKYRVTVTEWGQQLVPGTHVEVHRAAAAAALVANVVRSVTVSGNTATVDFEVWSLAGALTDLATTDKVAITLAFSKTKPVY